MNDRPALAGKKKLEYVQNQRQRHNHQVGNAVLPYLAAQIAEIVK